MKRLFSLEDKSHGHSPILYSWQNTQGSFIAITGSENKVRIYDRRGELIEETLLHGRCSGLGWERDGNTLAIIDEVSFVIHMWDANKFRTSQIDTGFKDNLTLLVWSTNGPYLAIGTSKGNLLIYNQQTSRKEQVLGKHTRKITCGAWSKENLLALAGADRCLTISNCEGETLRQMMLQNDPTSVQFSEMKGDERSTSGENTVSLVVGKKSLYLYNMDTPDDPITLQFQARYGSIVSYKWFGDGYIMIGFSKGFFNVISTHLLEIGKEIVQAKNHKEILSAVAISQHLNKAAISGDNCIKVYDLSDLNEIYDIINLDDERGLDNVSWTDDGQLFAVSTKRGCLHIYLNQLPMLGASWLSRSAWLTSLQEVTIEDHINREGPICLSIEMEPSFLGIGPDHLAVGMNNRAWFYFLINGKHEKLCDREYLLSVKSIQLNSDFAAVLFERNLQLHLIEGEMSLNVDERESRMFPDHNQSNVKITCFCLTQDFLLFGMDNGMLQVFFMEDWNFVTEYEHDSPIRSVFYHNIQSDLAVFIDNKHFGFLFNPVSSEILEIVNISPCTIGVLWETWAPEKNVFATFDDGRIYTYVNTHSINGVEIQLIGETKIPSGQKPLVLHNGELSLQTQSGRMVFMTLDTHTAVINDNSGDLNNYPVETLTMAFEQCLALRRYQDCWLYCQHLNSTKFWTKLAYSAMSNHQLEFATRVFRQIGCVDMVLALNWISDYEESSLISGHIAMYMSEFNLAQDLFLSSSCPLLALEMRRDLMHWDSALQLAKTLAPDQIAHISQEYAQQLEFTGDYSNALMYYEKALDGGLSEADGEYKQSCLGGVARMAIRMGDIRKGIGIAMKIPSKGLKRECAAILEGLKQHSDAAVLYEHGGYYDKAASVYIKTKNWSKVGEMLSHISSPKIFAQFAKAKEADGKYREAEDAYARAKDWENVIRVNLDFLQNPEKAVQIVKEYHSIEGAKMVAKFFQQLNDFVSAIQFLVMSNCNDEAFQLAHTHGKMEVYADVIGSDATVSEYQSIALYFENDQHHFLAGKFFLLAGQYPKALKQFLRCSENDGESIDLAIETVGRAQDTHLTTMLLEYLMGDTDNIPKDAKYLFRLYMALKQYREAAKTAIIIAREEQNAGNYRNAHSVLFSMYQELRRNQIKIPAEMQTSLMILHSYIIGKMFVKKGDHSKGARMLIRVANNISRFPLHIVPILTSTVIECHRAGFKKSSFNYAAMLLRPEYRNLIDLKYKKKIEQIVRKPDKSEQDEMLSPCPYCHFHLPETDLTCAECKNTIPYCIASGKHIIQEDFCVCCHCNFPAIKSQFVYILETEDRCPMCCESLSLHDLMEPDIKTYLNTDPGLD